MQDPFEAMQKAVDAVQTSPHPTHKIGAALRGWGPEGAEKLAVCSNHWPAAIDTKIGRETRIGSSSGTVHAEVAAILTTHRCDGGMMFLTDPPCPNCMKNMVETGIRTLFIDHKGFEKAYMAENTDHVEDMSLEIARRAGMGVFKLFRKDRHIETLVPQAQDRDIAEEYPIRETSLLPDEEIDTRLDAFITSLRQTGFSATRYAACTVRIPTGQRFLWVAQPHHVLGSDAQGDAAARDKYSFTVEPLTRLLMRARQLGAVIEPDSVLAAQSPTSRELVNFVAAGFDRIIIREVTQARDADALAALDLLSTSGVLDIQRASVPR